MRQVLQRLDEQWQITEAENGKDAVAQAREFKPDLVVLDLVMPGGDGLTAAREIAELLPDVPILMHTLYVSPQVESEAGRVGVRKVVPKSESSVLISAVQDVLNPKPPTDPAAAPSCAEGVGPDRRTEDKIRELCNRLFAMKDETAHAPLAVELQALLHKHIEQLRARVAAYPAIERRVRLGTLPPIAAAESPEKGAAKK
jgi:DNA-binding NarL/FixJ family response regulator